MSSYELIEAAAFAVSVAMVVACLFWCCFVVPLHPAAVGAACAIAACVVVPVDVAVALGAELAAAVVVFQICNFHLM